MKKAMFPFARKKIPQMFHSPSHFDDKNSNNKALNFFSFFKHFCAQQIDIKIDDQVA